MHRWGDGYLGQALNAALPCCVQGERHKSLPRNPEKRKLQGWSLLVRRARVTLGWRRAPSVQPVTGTTLRATSPLTHGVRLIPGPTAPHLTARVGAAAAAAGPPGTRRAGDVTGQAQLARMQSTEGSSAHSISHHPRARSRRHASPRRHAHPRLQVSSHTLLPKQKQNKNTFPKET